MIPNDFKVLFSEFNEWHLSLYTELNSKYMAADDLQQASEKRYPEFVHHMTGLANVCSNLQEDLKGEIKNYIRRSDMYRIIQESDWVRQIIQKPYGYAGDFEMMQIMYRNSFEGKSNFGKVYGKLTNSVEGSQAVRNRKTLLQSEILKHQNGNVLSVAAGPAEEIKEVIKGGLRPNLRFLALDHDINTLRKSKASNLQPQLKYALTNVFNIIKGDTRILYPKTKNLDRLNPKKDFKGWRILLAPFKYKTENLNNYKFNLIYSAGLFDYIKTLDDTSKGTVSLTQRLFNLLEPGGELIIGNYNPSIPIGTRWHLEYICDWNLIYRNDDEVFEFSKAINREEISELKIEREPTGINSFLFIRKK